MGTPASYVAGFLKYQAEGPDGGLFDLRGALWNQAV
jgi:hypothetical protein